MNQYSPEQKLQMSINQGDLQSTQQALYEIIMNNHLVSVELGGVCMFEQGMNVYHNRDLYYCQRMHTFCRNCLQGFLYQRYQAYGESEDYYCPHCPNLWFYQAGRKVFFLNTVFSLQGEESKQINVIEEKKATLAEIPLNHNDALEVIKNFQITSGKKKVKKIERITNPGLEKDFQLKKKEFFGMNFYGIDEVWHGTDSNDKVKKICDQGFLIGGKDINAANGKYFGEGVNTSKESQVCFNYAKKTKVLILSDGLLGNSTQVQGQKDGFHSFVGPNVVVFYHPSQVMPRYLVHYKD
jgi:hypothetical protein